MTARQSIFRVRRNYNQWVANQTLEDYALRFTAKRARRWSLSRVSNTALGAISFLVLEAIGGAITLNYGFTNAAYAIAAVSIIIFCTSMPISYYASKYGIDIDLLTRGAGFGYIGSTITSLIYASFTFIFFALEAAIMAMALEHLAGIPLSIGYVLNAILVIPLVTYGITFISRFQQWTQPIWLILQILPFIYIAAADVVQIDDWTQFRGNEEGESTGFNILLFGAASAVLFSLIAQIGEQVDFLRFLPPKTKKNNIRWWIALVSAGPGWIIVGALKIFAGSFLAVLAFHHGIPFSEASDPTQMYLVAFSFLTTSPGVALGLAGIFVIICQLKINVTNAYAGSIAWSNFFSRLTHNHPGRVVWLVFNVVIAVLLMELGIYRAFESILGVYAIVAVAWVGALTADLIINKPLGLSPPMIEFKRAYLYDINPVGFGAMVLASLVGISAHLGAFDGTSKALAPYLTLFASLLISPFIAWLTGGRYYIAREPDVIASDEAICCICEHRFEREDIAHCPVYNGYICSLCCSLDARCHDSCKTNARVADQLLGFLGTFMPARAIQYLNSKMGHFLGLMTLAAMAIALLLMLVYYELSVPNESVRQLVGELLWKEFFIFLIVAGVAAWLFVLAHESRLVAQEETQRQTELLHKEIEAHKHTDSELQKAKETAEAANNAKSRYLTGISHELRSPLNSVMGYAQLLETDSTIGADHREAINVILRGSEHLSDLIEGLLDISKIEAGRLDLHRNEVRLPMLMDQLVDMFQLQAQAKGIEFVYTKSGRLPDFVSTDEKRLRQILINLLSNAIKFTDKGRVYLHLRYRSQVAEFSVTDSGVGIDSKNIDMIFKPFERVREPGQVPAPGTGLGLTITRLLTEIMGGEISVQSELGVGSTFTVSLMLSSIANPSVDPTPAQRIKGYIGSRKKVLVVDDEFSHRVLIRHLLEPMGFELAEATNAQDCLLLIDSWQPDLFLLDVSMPGTNGLELVAQLRKRQCIQPIIMISADANEGRIFDEHEEDTLERSFDAYLIKPVRLSDLLEKMAALLDIQWIYEQRLAETNHVQGLQSLPDYLPELGVLQELKSMAEIGHLQGLKKRLASLKEEADIDIEFIQYLTLAIQQVRLDRIIALAEANTS